MKTIKDIIYNLRNGQDQEFDLFNNRLGMQWTLSFEFIEDDIYMTCNHSTLTGLFFESLEELEMYLKSTFISDLSYELY